MRPAHRLLGWGYAFHNLEEFLKYYHEHDGWTNNATDVLRRLSDPNAVPQQRPIEPAG